MHGQAKQNKAIALKLEGISRQLGHQGGVSGLSLEVATGEILALIGRTGAGKSTVLRILAGLESVDSGTLTIFNQNAIDLKPNQRKLSMIFQRDIFYPGQPLETDWRRAQAAGLFKQWADVGLGPDLILQELQLEPAFLRQKPETYSGGEGRRASLLRTMLQNRDLILADEPLNGLDLGTRDRVSRLLWRFVKATGKTLVIVAHEPTDALGIADRIAVMQNGRLLQTGPGELLMSRPNHVEIKNLLHFPPWNEIPSDNAQHRRFVPPSACWVETVEPDSQTGGIAVAFLRQRCVNDRTYAEWQCQRTSQIFWTPMPAQPLLAGQLCWSQEAMVAFCATTGQSMG
jgi:ABC-type sugar transport system ATPase subunit